MSWLGSPRSALRSPLSAVSPTVIDVSVCIANWNCRDLLRRCLESLCDQPQGISLEVIVVDNASGDGAPEMVARAFPQVTVHHNTTNVGFARANNQAAARARGRYLFFLNNDTVVPAGVLHQLVEFAEEHPHVGMIGPRLRDGAGKLQASYRTRPTLATFLHRTSLLRSTGLFRRLYRRCRRQEFDPENIRPVDVLLGAAMLLPREVFFACGGWDEDYRFGGEDLDLSYRVSSKHPVVFYPQVEIIHYGRTSTRQNISFAAPNIMIGFLKYLRKTGCSRTALLGYKIVVTLDAPVQMLEKGLQYLWRRACGRRTEGDKSLLAMRGLWHFLIRGLVPFWRT